ncbi:MAG: Asp-tRNA(Asn)/Glu-tRNA(Gln) amidotransferase GatCAB subunit B [Bdellovibrionales bacterium CG10_big_fil_rev_8_21_14_0_10_45_34]|nr:MAG: Asp-tRNA(Asn)/Glu-tRNA(Gln) amidotransferase GatCAB subunit B [Bdellovibrionales bacterium CG10_big_fil_rev_8_21_14_0_10_45_34]
MAKEYTTPEGFEAVIGLEIHAQLLTHSKMFCGCSTEFGKGDNANTCPTCLGMPGALPVLNKKALEFSALIGLGLNCEVRKESVFARKNYFYPDLPKGYQISQFDKPLCENGHLEYLSDGTKKRVRIERAHMEEDAGKSTHHGTYSVVNYNRSSVPLLEIVSGPDMRGPLEAADYARAVRAILVYLDVCDGNLEEGSMRCDCNVSVRRSGEQKLGTKVEIKNINSFRFIEKALQFEIERQVDAVQSGEKIVQETRLYDPDKNRTFTMRTKEEAHDYRYFPEPDLLPVVIDEAFMNEVRAKLPELPLQKAYRFQKEYEIPEYDAFVLTQSRELADYFELVARSTENPKISSNWVMVELLAKLNEQKMGITRSPVPASALAGLINLMQKGVISGRTAKDVFAEMFETGASAEQIIKEKGLAQISGNDEIKKVIQEVFVNSPNQLAQYRSGKDKLFGYFVGQVMKATSGQANPEVTNELLKEMLKGS